MFIFEINESRERYREIQRESERVRVRGRERVCVSERMNEREGECV